MKKLISVIFFGVLLISFSACEEWVRLDSSRGGLTLLPSPPPKPLVEGLASIQFESSIEYKGYVLIHWNNSWCKPDQGCPAVIREDKYIPVNLPETFKNVGMMVQLVAERLEGPVLGGEYPRVWIQKIKYYGEGQIVNLHGKLERMELFSDSHFETRFTIAGADGKTYFPVKLDPALQRDGLEIVFSAYFEDDQYSILEEDSENGAGLLPGGCYGGGRRIFIAQFQILKKQGEFIKGEGIIQKYSNKEFSGLVIEEIMLPCDPRFPCPMWVPSPPLYPVNLPVEFQKPGLTVFYKGRLLNQSVWDGGPQAIYLEEISHLIVIDDGGVVSGDPTAVSPTPAASP